MKFRKFQEPISWGPKTEGLIGLYGRGDGSGVMGRCVTLRTLGLHVVAGYFGLCGDAYMGAQENSDVSVWLGLVGQTPPRLANHVAGGVAIAVLVFCPIRATLRPDMRVTL